MSVSLESVLHTFDAMERYFRGGFGWGTGFRHNPVNRTKCLMGAVESVRATSDGNRSWVPSETLAAAVKCMRQAVRERGFLGSPDDSFKIVR